VISPTEFSAAAQEPVHSGGPTPAISVVIPTRNRAAYLQQALDGVLAGAWQDFEVLVMDQSDGEDTHTVAERFDPRVVYRRVERRGACPARNLGAALSRAGLVAFLDDDCVPRPDWLARIVHEFRSDPRLEFIFGQLKAPVHGDEAGWFPETLFPRNGELERAPWKIAVRGAGANMACRKEFLRRVGGFDELLGPHEAVLINSDASMAYKAFREARWIASPDIEVIHENGFRTHRELGTLLRVYARELGANYGRFTRRGDLYAVRLFLTEQVDIVRGALMNIMRGQRPRGVRSLPAYARGFWAGVRMPPRVGYVDGAVLRRMESTRSLDG
jgi:glycosyltransferase involved in cell wall biosynthesis